MGSFNKIQRIRQFTSDLRRWDDDYELWNDYHPSEYHGAIEFLNVMQFFASNDIQLDLALVRTVCGGNLPKPNEKPRGQDRDFFFELKVARYLYAFGAKVDLTKDTDIVAEIAGRKIFIECKRLWSESNKIKQYKKAEKQLFRRIQGQDCRPRGWVYLDASYLLNEGKLPYPTRHPIAPITAMQTELRYLWSDIAEGIRATECKEISHTFMTCGWIAMGTTLSGVQEMNTTAAFKRRSFLPFWERRLVQKYLTSLNSVDMRGIGLR